MQKEYKYLLIGNGRLASHLSFYFDNQKIDYLNWNRSLNVSLAPLILQSDKILLAISDDGIKPFIFNHLRHFLKNKTIIHFSGSLSFDGIESAHPLMTFGSNIYTEDVYKKIPFITEKGKLPFSVLFPELPNPRYEIDSESKPYYHAWCSIAGNFTTILWQNFEEKMKSNFNIPKKDIYPYLQKVMENINENGSPLTGPFARRDFNTINNHKEVLKDDLIFGIYNEFYKYYFNKNLNNEANIENN